jgi:hypothetical protein
LNKTSLIPSPELLQLLPLLGIFLWPSPYGFFIFRFLLNYLLIEVFPKQSI